MLGLANIIYWLQLHVSNTGSLNLPSIELAIYTGRAEQYFANSFVMISL